MKETTFQNRLRTLRKQRKISQQALAELCGLKGKDAISKYECGKRMPTVKTLRELSEIFGVSMGYLAGEE